MADLAHSPTLAADPEVRDRLAAGSFIGEYEIERFVGAGAMGVAAAALYLLTIPVLARVFRPGRAAAAT